MKTKVLKFLVQFFAICGAIALVLTLVDLWAGLAAMYFIAAAMVSYLFYDFYRRSKFSAFYVKDGEQKNCIIRAENCDEAERKVEELYHVKPSLVIQLDVEL